MQFTASLAFLASLAGLASTSPIPATTVEERDSSLLSSAGLSRLQALGFGAGVNAQAAGTSGVWIGTDGPYVMQFSNTSPDDVVLVAWGSEPAFQASFPIAVQPLVTATIPANSNASVSLSFASGQSGAFAGVYADTAMSEWGQISQTWGEFTMSPTGVVDVSREVFAQGNSLSIVGPGGTTDMNTCVFQCIDTSATTCGDAGSYQLNNCAAGSQPGAQSSTDGFNGGVGWNGATTATFTATFS